MLFRSNDTATTEIYTTYDTLSLHDALPISGRGADARNQLLEKPRVADGHGDLAPSRLESARRGDRIEDDQSGGDTRVAQGECLVEGRHAQCVGARLGEGPRDRDHPVAVRVGLDDRLHEDPGPGESSDKLQVRGQRIEVELEPGRSRQRR